MTLYGMKRTTRPFKRGYDPVTGEDIDSDDIKAQKEDVYKKWMKEANEKGLTPISSNITEGDETPDYNIVRRFMHNTPKRKWNGLTDDMMFLRTDDGQIIALSDSSEPLSGLTIKTEGGESLPRINRSFSRVDFDKDGVPTLSPLFTTEVLAKPLRDMDQKQLYYKNVEALSPTFGSLDPEFVEIVRDMYTQGEDGKYTLNPMYQIAMDQPVWNFTHILKQPGTYDIPKITSRNLVPAQAAGNAGGAWRKRKAAP